MSTATVPLAPKIDDLSDRICGRLLELFYQWTFPGGLVVATNVHPANPVKNYMEHVLEWHLYYRDEKDMSSVAPDGGRKSVVIDETGVNVFLEIRKVDSE